MATIRALFACIFLASFMPGNAFAQACESLATLKWLLGAWRAEDERSTTHESWDQVSPKTFEGQAEVVQRRSGENEGLETLRLVEMSGVVYYIAKVGHNDLPVAFRALECSDTGATFVNPGHDFPKRLVYRLEGGDRLTVEVSDGGSKGFSLEFLRQ
jgi:hypothetical protein